jgi:hypothetical protein
MRYSSAVALGGVFMVAALFAVLFLQNAYVRQRLGDIETTSMSARKASCPDVDNAVRAYALRIATVRMTQLNSGSRRPRVPREAFSQTLCGTKQHNRNNMTYSGSARGPALNESLGFWLVLRRTSTSSQLQQDVETGRTQYLILSNAVVRVFPVTLSKHFSDLETSNLAVAYVVLGLAGAVSSEAQTCGVAQVILPPWIDPSADVTDAMEPAAATVLPVGMLLDVVSALSTAPSSAARAPQELLKDRTVHLWGYGRATSDSAGTMDGDV